MGRTTLAAELVAEAFKGMRPGGPVFDIPPAGDAVDWHLRLFGDLNGELNEVAATEQIRAFSTLSATHQASTILASLQHWGDLNQVVTIRHRWGLRDRGNQIKPWLSELISQLKESPTIRLILISERQLPRPAVADATNIKQFSLEELDIRTIEYILSDRINSRFMDAQRLPTLAAKINGHPDTANHVSYLVNSGRSIESLVLAPDAVTSFQDKILSEIFTSSALTVKQKLILKLLCWFPNLSLHTIREAFNEDTPTELANQLWYLVEFSLVDQAELGRYKVPAVVSSTFRRFTIEGDVEIFRRMTRILRDQFESSELDYELIDAFLVAVVASGEELTDKMVGALTPARIEPVIELEYYEGIGALGNDTAVHFERCYKLARLVMNMKTTDDLLENILFFGADAAVRQGEVPEDMLSLMRSRGFFTADYIEASYLYHRKRDYGNAARVLSKSLQAARFRTRNVRLLARIYLRMGKFSLALDTLNSLSDTRLLRDTGLIIMKVKALRGTRDRTGAQTLLASLRDVSDDYGDYAIYKASAAIRETRYDEALRFISQAKDAPRANRAVLSFLQCACEIESGDNTNVASTCALARSMGRDGDALQLQARASLKSGDWRQAQDYISRVEKKDWFDLNVALRIVDAKLNDPATSRNPVELSSATREKEDILRQTADAVEGSSFA